MITKEYNISINILFIFITSLCSIYLQHFYFPISNNLIHVPIVLGYADSAEGPHDLFTKSLENFITWFWILLKPVATENNIFAIFFIMHFLTRFFTGIFLLSILSRLTLFNPLRIVVVCTLLFFLACLSRSPLGEQEIATTYLTHSQVVIAFVFAAWLALLHKRFVVAAVIIGLSFNVNAFVAVWTGLACGLVTLWLSREQGIKVILQRATAIVVAFVIFATPTIFWIGDTLINVPDFEPFSFRDFLYKYYPYHTFPHLRKAQALIIIIISIIIIMIPTFSDWREKNMEERDIIHKLSLCYASIIAFAFIMPYVTDSRLLLNLYPLRMDAFVIFLLAIVLSVRLLDALNRQDRYRQLLAIAAWVSLLNGNIPLLLTAFTLSAKANQDTKAEWVGVILICSLCAFPILGVAPIIVGERTTNHWVQVAMVIWQIALIAVFMVRINTYSSQNFLLPLMAASVILNPEKNTIAAFLIVGLFVFAGLSIRDTLAGSKIAEKFLSIAVPGIAVFLFAAAFLISQETVIFAASSIILVIIIILRTSKFKYERFAMFFQPKIILYSAFASFIFVSLIFGTYRFYGPKAQSLRAHIDAQKWARNNTPSHTIFLPVDVDGFTTLSRRPVWIDWKTGAMVMWSPELYAHWSSRYSKLEKIKTIEDAIDLMSKEQVDYLVFSKESRPHWFFRKSCVRFENASIEIIARPAPDELLSNCIADRTGEQ